MITLFVWVWIMVTEHIGLLERGSLPLSARTPLPTLLCLLDAIAFCILVVYRDTEGCWPWQFKKVGRS